MATFLVISTLVIAPAGILLYYFWVRDRWEREPWSYTLLLFGAGCLSVIPAAIIEVGIHYGSDLKTVGEAFFVAFFVAGLVEELVKFGFVYFLTLLSRNFTEEYDGIVYSVAVGLGFALAENIMYAFAAFQEEGQGFVTVVSRAFTAVPMHGLDGVIMGFFIGQAHFMADRSKRIKTLLTGILIAILFHGLYDFFAFLMIPLPVGYQGWCIVGLAWIIVVQGGTAHRFVRTAQERSCAQWGFALHPSVIDPASSTTAPSSPSRIPLTHQTQISARHFCRFCGKKITPNAIFCATCGSKLD